jgi:hypothetical protein
LKPVVQRPEPHPFGTEIVKPLKPNAPAQAIEANFPGAAHQSVILSAVNKTLKTHNFQHILFATSCCPDEINRDLDDYEGSSMGRPFCMGGLAGFPFVGKTGFGAFMHHVAENGIMLIICASHVGVHENGEIGKLRRLGMKEDSTACEASIEAYNFLKADPSRVHAIIARDANVYPAFNDHYDYQQAYLQVVVAKRYDEIANAPNPMAKLARVVYDQIILDIHAIMPKERHFPVAVLGGIQINIESEDGNNEEDYFMPVEFAVYDPQGNKNDLSGAFNQVKEEKHKKKKEKKGKEDKKEKGDKKDKGEKGDKKDKGEKGDKKDKKKKK